MQPPLLPSPLEKVCFLLGLKSRAYTHYYLKMIVEIIQFLMKFLKLD